MNSIDPVPSQVELVQKAIPDSIWKKWLNNVQFNLQKLLDNRFNYVFISNANLGKGVSAPTQVVIGNYTGWEFTVGDDAVFDVEMPHDADADFDIGVHFTFVVNEAYATNSGEVQWQIDYSCTPHIDGGETITAPTHSGTLTSGDVNIPATIYEPEHVNSMSIPAADWDNGDIIGIKLSRIAITAGNNPTANPVLLSAHIEYTRRSIDWYGAT